jgi:hypothetical protein
MTPRNQNMSRAQESGHDDRLFVHYLLGLLAQKDAERLDELSIGDEDVATLRGGERPCR